MALRVRGESSATSSNSNSTSKWRFHVFLSFMGQDTRRNFTDHLYSALWKRGIITFRDDEGMEKGEDVPQQLLKAIEDSLCAIVVLSKNYAFSTWCLDELQNILKSRNKLGRKAFSVFYGVDPSDVRRQRESFAEALKKHEERFRESKEKVQRWRDALTEAANLSGWNSRDQHETDLIEDIVEAIWTELCSKLPSYDDNLVGINSRIVEMNSQFGIGLDDIRFIGIWGMGGIGKTTLARAVYERMYSQFDIYCFLANIREASLEREGEDHLQRKLLSHLKICRMEIKDKYEGKKIIKNIFCNRKVLLVLDDVDHIGQLKNLAGSSEWFGAGSRIIITTRDLHLLKSHRVHGIYEVKTMGEYESLQVFSKNAFNKDHPEKGYFELSKFVVNYTGGLPLALAVLGSFLCERSAPEWEDALDRLKQTPDKDILKILQISFDGLNNEEKTIFLDIACFFKGWKKDEVTRILKNCGLHPTIGLSILIQKALLIEKNDRFGNCCLEMHDLLQELGRSIVFRESPNACRRSRLWNSKDIYEVLNNNAGTNAIQGIALPINLYETHWDPRAFSKMCNLQLLIVSIDHLSKGLNLPRGLKCLSSTLKVVQWPKYPLESLPLEIPLDKLVNITMHESKIKQLWNGIQCFGELKFIDLSYSKYLIETPNFSEVPNLESLILVCCTSLVKVHPSVGELKKLVLMNLSNCSSLEILPRKLEMDSLTMLNLYSCSKVRKLPKFGKIMKNLSLLDLRKTAITGLPESIEFLTGLKDLRLAGCKLKHNKTLNFCGCQEISSSNSRILCHITGSYLTSLTELDLRNCGISDVSIPDDIGGLTSLFVLDLGENNFVNLPASCISKLLRLHYLFLDSCQRLKSLPKLPPCLVRLDTLNCQSMEPLSDRQLWNLFSSLDHEHRRRSKYVGTLLEHIESEYLPQREFFATIPESEIPSWFPNKDYFLSYDDVLIMVDIPQSCRASEWSKIVVCLCLEMRHRFSSVFISCTSRASEDYKYICKEWVHVIGNPQIPHLCLMILDCNDQTCWQGLKGDNNCLQIKLSLTGEGSLLGDGSRQVPLPYGELQILGCGWRVLCKEEMEEWCNKNDFNKVNVAEVGTSDVWVPPSILDKTLRFKVFPNQDRNRKREQMV